MKKDSQAQQIVLDEQTEGGEVELIDGEVVDADESTWAPAPGEPPPGEPADEVLEVHELTTVEPPADELDVPPDGLELPGGDEDEPAEEIRAMLDDILPRTVIRGRDLESRYEEFDEEAVALARLEAAQLGHRTDAVLCRRCFLWKHREQFDDPERRVCHDCT